MTTQYYQAKKYQQNQDITVSDWLTVEAVLQIKINGFPFMVTMCTPGNDKELIRGLLFSEDVYRVLNTELTEQTGS